MEKNNIGEEILNHYENFLGMFEECMKFKSDEDMPLIQLLQYDNIFEGCKTYASLGLSKFSEIINNVCEVILAVDDDYEKAAVIFANVLFYIIENKIDFGRGVYITGIENIDKEFAINHKKNAIYFTETYIFPDEFSNINKIAKMYLAFFISQEECNFIKNYGCEKFEDYLEAYGYDIMDLNR